jgi:hypothetical protein
MTTIISFLSLAPKITQRTRTRRPRPKQKTTLSPKIPHTEPGKYVAPGLCTITRC